MTNWDKIIGHDWAVDVLRAAIKYSRVGHAYLFTGPEQIGKTTLATTFAQALNCTFPEAGERPCGRCRSCTLIEAGRHPDLRLVVGETSHRGVVTLKIDQIRQLQLDLNLTAAEARYKIAIIQQINTATPGAANAFLKTLEEPPHNVILLLTAVDADTLLPTIPSRCRTINLRPLPVSAIQEALVSHQGMAPERAALLAHLSGGRLGWAIETAADESILASREDQLDSLTSTFTMNRVKRFAHANDLVKYQDQLPGLLKTWVSWWRDLLLLSTGHGDNGNLTNIDRLEEFEGLLKKLPGEVVLASLQETEQSIVYLEAYANTRLVMENLLLHIPVLAE